MSAPYQLNLNNFSLQKLKKSLQKRSLIPSRTGLKNELDARFRILEDRGIENLKMLIDTIKTKKKVEQFSQETGLPVEYLTLLNQEAKSYLAKPVRSDKIPGIP